MVVEQQDQGGPRRHVGGAGIPAGALPQSQPHHYRTPRRIHQSTSHQQTVAQL